MTQARNTRRLKAKAKRDMFVRRGLVAQRIFRMTAPTPHAQKQRLVLIDRLIAIADAGDYDPIKVFETLAMHRYGYNGCDPSVEWFDDLAAHLLAEKQMRDGQVTDYKRRWYKEKEWNALIEPARAKTPERVAMELDNAGELPK